MKFLRFRAAPVRSLRAGGAIFAALVLAVSAVAQTPVARQLRNTGPNASRLNVAILGDGYTAAQQEQFFADAQRRLDTLVNSEAFAPVRDLINGVAIFTASNESGTDIAADNITRDTYYDTGFSGSVNARLLVVATTAGRTRAQNALREFAPDYDISVVLVNTTIYGGAGGTLTVTSLHALSDEILLHEIGHSFGKLTDEYVDAVSAPAYPPAEFPNATQKTLRAELPWRDFVLESTPVPTTASSTDVNFSGAWEGAHYRATGFYRPIFDSKMRSLSRPFGPINLRAFAAAIHRLNLNGATAPPSNLSLTVVTASANPGGTLALRVRADGVGPLTYQWSFNGKFLPGRTGDTLTLTGVSSANVGEYSVGVTNAVGSATTAAAGLTAWVVSQSSGGAFGLQIGTQPVVRWSRSEYLVSEQDGSVTLTASRSGSAAGPLRVTYFTTESGTARAPADFSAQSGYIIWADGETSDKKIVIPIVSDQLAEGIETFGVRFGGISAGIFADPEIATVSIADPGTRDPTFSANFINNTVNRIIVLPDGSVLIAGLFSSVQDAFGLSYPFGRIARLKADGTLDPGFKPGVGADGVIHGMVRQPDGKIIIGGDFTNYDGTPRTRLARLNADGSLDSSFTASANGIVYDLLLQADGRVVVTGAFTECGGSSREYVARLNSDGTVDGSFVGPDFGGTTAWRGRSIVAMPDGRLLLGGVFFFAGATQRASLVRLNSNGSLDPSFTGIVQGAGTSYTAPFLGEIRRVAVQPDGRILICGDIASYNQVARRGIARLSATGAIDPSFDPGTGADQPIDTLLLQADGSILVGGRFTSFNGVAVNRLARLNPDGSLDASFVTGAGLSTGVTTLVAQPDGHVLVGSSVASFQGSTSTRPIWRFVSGLSPTASPAAPYDSGRLINLSVLTTLASAEDNFTFGVVVGGAGTIGGKPLLVRAAGPSLAALGVQGALEDPKLEFYTNSTKVGENDNWGGAANISTVMASVGAFAFSSPNSRDAAISLPSLASGANSAKISGTGAGTVIAELYDATPSGGFTASTPRLVNVSVLKHLGSGVTAGFVIAGSTSRTVLIRAIGPTLGQPPFGVSDVVADPRLGLYSGQVEIAASDNWGGLPALSAAFAQVGAFALPAVSRDAAMLITLSPGNYTAQVNGVGGTTGVALIEIYEVP